MSTRRELERTLAEVQAPGNDKCQAIKKFLRLVRELRVRDSENVTLYGSQLLQTPSKLTNDELWLIREQVAFAAMDCKDLEVAKNLSIAIHRQFPESFRGNRVRGMFLEAIGKADEASKVYAELLEENPSDESILKRSIALQKTLGNTQGAIDLLKKYLDIFLTDREAWEELAELYLQVQLYSQAAFCYEEVMLHSPTSAALHVQYADVLYTIGGSANYKTARAHYSAAVQFSGGANVRALYGICSCAAQLSGKAASRGSRDGSEGPELTSLAAEALIKIYREQAPSKAGLVRECLLAQGVITQQELLSN